MTITNTPADRRDATPADPAPPARPTASPAANNPEHVRPSALRKLLRED